MSLPVKPLVIGVALALLGAAGLWLGQGEEPLPVQAPVQVGADAPAETLVPVPSGQPVTLQDVVRDTAGPEGLTVRFRFLAPEIARDGGSVTLEQALDDMLVLCTTYALPRVASTGPVPSQIVIALSDVAVPFGQAAPDATQYFEAYSLGEDACIWDMF